MSIKPILTLGLSAQNLKANRGQINLFASDIIKTNSIESKNITSDVILTNKLTSKLMNVDDINITDTLTVTNANITNTLDTKDANITNNANITNTLSSDIIVSNTVNTKTINVTNVISNIDKTKIGYNVAISTNSSPTSTGVINSALVSLCQGYELSLCCSRGTQLTASQKNFFGIYPDALGNGNYNPIVKTNDHVLFTGKYGVSDITDSIGGIVLCPWSSVSSGMRMDPSGNFTIVTTTPSTSQTTGALVVSGGVGVGGNVWASGFYGTLYPPSDYRIKENIIPLDTSYSVDNLKPVKYYNKINKKTEIGLIAHELQHVYPYLVNGEKDDENYQSVNYIGLIGILIGEIKTLKQKVNELEKKLSN